MVEKNPETVNNKLETEDISDEKTVTELLALQDRFLRLGAEFENFKKRTERDKQNAVKFANEMLIIDLLPILDHLEQAAEISNNKDTASSALNYGVSTGIKMVIKQLEELLVRYGARRFSAIDEIFDPNRHEAVEQKDDAERVGKIIQEYQKGCLLHERLIRPARVVVGK